MEINGKFLRSKLGRRIFSLFICCSIIPIAALSLLSFGQVMRHLEDQSQRRLQQSTKAFGMSIFERLTLMDSEFRQAELDYKRHVPVVSEGTSGMDDKGPYGKRFKGIVVYESTGQVVPLLGEINEPISFTKEELDQFGNEKTAIVTRTSSTRQPRIYMVRVLDQAESLTTLLVGELNICYLWSIGPNNTLPPMTDLCVLDHRGAAIISSISDPTILAQKLAPGAERPKERIFHWERQADQHMASFWTLFMRSGFECPNWTIILSQSKADIFAPLDDFKLIFTLITLLSILVVAFLSMYYIRQTLVPLETLKEGISQISNKEFNTRIEVNSGDEFEEVAATFNEMTAQLGRQFHAISTMSEIDRAILSSLDTDRIIGTALTAMRGFFSCELISINLLDPHEEYTAYSYVADKRLMSETLTREHGAERLLLDPREIGLCLEHPDQMIFALGEAAPAFLQGLPGNGAKSWLVLPVLVKTRLAATVNMGYFPGDPIPKEDMIHARRLADQMAIALSNSALIEELDQLNWGTLKALARTVDAKSPWTAGHSERVTDLALRLASRMGLSQEEKDDLHRGAYLHDIGKIGVPNRLLDKTGKLTDQEYERIKQHSAIGARILEPIGAYQRIIPIVGQHHERFDGRGYPHGLSGEAIHLGARILAVADVYDAMVSNRPYRDGLLRSHVVDYIRKAAGEQFDPRVVEAFLYVMSEEDAFIGHEGGTMEKLECA